MSWEKFQSEMDSYFEEKFNELKTLRENVQQQSCE